MANLFRMTLPSGWYIYPSQSQITSGCNVWNSGYFKVHLSCCTYYSVNLLLLAEYSEIFNHLDPGSTGSLSRDELVIALRLAGHNPTRDEIDQLLAHKQGKDMSFLIIGLLFNKI